MHLNLWPGLNNGAAYCGFGMCMDFIRLLLSYVRLSFEVFWISMGGRCRREHVQLQFV